MFYFGILAMPVRALGIIVNMASRAASAGARIFEVLDTDPEIVNKHNAVVLDSIKGQVRFDKVNFSYDESVPALQNISFNVNPGDMVALVGTSGSGKSTIASLIPRFYDVKEGVVTIDGIDVRDIDVRSLRRSVGIVQQDIFLFAATIRENILYGAVGATQQQIEDAAKSAHLHQFIERLSDGYDTWVGERGVTLSGGEKQRLSIARTLLMNPPILVFDDSTSSVDIATERFIYDAIRELSRNRTTFIITNRLSLIRNANLILVMDKGSLVASGKHDELLETNDIYKQIYQLQSADTANFNNQRGGDQS
jgi:ATP-binding cassette subfamily B protein